jgi:hypothetical protein
MQNMSCIDHDNDYDHYDDFTTAIDNTNDTHPQKDLSRPRRVYFHLQAIKR